MQPDILEAITTDILEDFLDTVFVTVTRPSKDEFIDKLSNDFAKYLLPCYIRSIVLKKIISVSKNGTGATTSSQN